MYIVWCHTICMWQIVSFIFTYVTVWWSRFTDSWFKLSSTDPDQTTHGWMVCSVPLLSAPYFHILNHIIVHLMLESSVSLQYGEGMIVNSNFCKTDLRIYITQMYSHIYFFYVTHVPTKCFGNCSLLLLTEMCQLEYCYIFFSGHSNL